MDLLFANAILQDFHAPAQLPATGHKAKNTLGSDSTSFTYAQVLCQLNFPVLSGIQSL